jgi:hypothetical protein
VESLEHYYLPVAYASDPDSRPVLFRGLQIARSHVYRVPAGEFVALVTNAMRAVGRG